MAGADSHAGTIVSAEAQSFQLLAVGLFLRHIANDGQFEALALGGLTLASGKLFDPDP